VYTPWSRPEPAVRGERPIDPETAKHEALHLGNALALGLRVIEARADNPEPDQAGRVRFLTADTRELALVTLAGELGTPGWPPEWPSKEASTPEERELAGYVDELRLDEGGYRELCAEARRIAANSRFADVVSVAEELMGRGVVLNEASIKMLCDSLLPADMATKAAGSVRHKSFGLTKAATSDAGWFTATVAVFNNVDKGGDRILPARLRRRLRSGAGPATRSRSSGRTNGPRRTRTSASRTPMTSSRPRRVCWSGANSTSTTTTSPAGSTS
jgi:hypothetical protein